MQVEADVKCMQTNFVDMAPLISEILLLLKFGQNNKHMNMRFIFQPTH